MGLFGGKSEEEEAAERRQERYEQGQRDGSEGIGPSAAINRAVIAMTDGDDAAAAYDAGVDNGRAKTPT